MRQNIAIAFIVLLVTAIPGLARADFAEGLRAYENGDYVTALREFREAADTGDARAQSKLGAMYDTGQGVERDDAEAVRWFRKAAERGDLVAQYSLGTMLGMAKASHRTASKQCGGSAKPPTEAT